MQVFVGMELVIPIFTLLVVPLLLHLSKAKDQKKIY